MQRPVSALHCTPDLDHDADDDRHHDADADDHHQHPNCDDDDDDDDTIIIINADYKSADPN